MGWKYLYHCPSAIRALSFAGMHWGPCTCRIRAHVRRRKAIQNPVSDLADIVPWQMFVSLRQGS